MTTIGFVGIGKIGLPMCGNLINAGHRVVGFRRGSLAEFEKLGGIAAHSATEVGAQADIVFTCLPSDEALEEVVTGEQGLLKSARPGQVIVEFGSHPVSVKERYLAPLAAKGAVFLDGEVSATPSMVAQHKGVIFLGGDEGAARRVEPIERQCVDQCVYFGSFGSATKAKLVNNLLVGIHIAGTAQAMAIGLRAGVDVELLIKAIATGSGGSMQFGLRAPWMAQRRFLPQAGSAAGLAEYLRGARCLATDVGVATPLLDCLIDIYDRAIPTIGERDVAAIIEFFEKYRVAGSTGRCNTGMAIHSAAFSFEAAFIGEHHKTPSRPWPSRCRTSQDYPDRSVCARIYEFAMDRSQAVGVFRWNTKLCGKTMVLDWFEKDNFRRTVQEVLIVAQRNMDFYELDPTVQVTLLGEQCKSVFNNLWKRSRARRRQ